MGFRVASLIPESNGDFNHNGTVDAADYVVWRHNSGSAVDYNLWRAHFGESITGSGASIESATFLSYLRLHFSSLPLSALWQVIAANRPPTIASNERRGTINPAKAYDSRRRKVK